MTKGPAKPGPRARRIGEMLRVDHAGEYGAVAIYRGQRAVFSKLPHKAETAAAIEEMEAGEEEHLKTFDALLAERCVRPSLLSPFWNAAGFGLGAATVIANSFLDRSGRRKRAPTLEATDRPRKLQ